jgi:hypothetical protein
MDYKEYKQTYAKLLSEQGRAQLGDDKAAREEVEKKITEFLEKYPTILPRDKDPSTPFHLLSLKEVFHRTMLTGVDIINDVSEILSERQTLGATAMRRKLFRAFTQEERRAYVGVWLLFFAVVFFFVDGSL